jgi:hypothetical protein
MSASAAAPRVPRTAVESPRRGRTPRRATRVSTKQHLIEKKGNEPRTKRRAARRALTGAALACCGLWLVACASGPERLALRARLTQVDLAGTTFRHRNYVRDAAGETLHLFIEGDGKPWLDGVTPAPDPTPNDPLTLRLMLQTPGPAAYVGRPCYFGIADTACKPYYWTHGRFAPEVVASMRAVVDALIDRAAARNCVLVGHSGGGALALLIAPDLAHRCRVVTVAGLVDTAAWTQWQRYEPLAGSLNPADTVVRLAAVPQVHLVGLRDRNIPAEQTKRALAGVVSAVVLEFERFDHGCCWQREWRRLLPTVDGDEAATR